MMIAITRRLCMLLAGLMLTGCSLSPLNIPILTRPGDKDAARFAQGLDKYSASGDLTILKQFPQGEWQPRAEIILTLARQHQQQELQLKTNAQQLASCQQEKAGLARDIQLLEETLARLKEVLIDSELQAK